MNSRQIASCIDHTCLKPEADEQMIEKLCEEALQNKFHGVCVNGAYVMRVAQRLNHSSVKCVAVVGFPLGASQTLVKCFEAERAVRDGADEIDMVQWVGALKSGQWKTVEDDIRHVIEASGGAPVKVILETSLLNHEEIIEACKIAASAGASFVKTSTGFSGEGAKVEHVGLMRSYTPAPLGIKASGGIRDRASAEALIAAGATRLGTSHGLHILSGETNQTFGINHLY